MRNYIDIHVHTVRDAQYEYGGRRQVCDVGDTLGFFDRFGVERGILLPLASPECGIAVCTQSNEEVLDIAAEHPDRFVPFCNVDPRSCGNSAQAPLADVLKWYRDRGCKGLGEIFANLHFLDPRVQNLFAAAEEVGFPVTFHCCPFPGNNYGLVDGKGLPELEESLRRFPKLRFFGHAQAFWCEIGEYEGTAVRFGFPKGKVKEGRIAKLMRKYPNLYGDLSANSGQNAISRDPEYGAKFLTEFQDRLLFGMDVCAPRGFVSPLPVFLKEWLEKGLISETVFDKVAHDNAVRILGI